MAGKLGYRRQNCGPSRSHRSDHRQRRSCVPRYRHCDTLSHRSRNAALVVHSAAQTMNSSLPSGFHSPLIPITASAHTREQVKIACWKLCKARITKCVLFDLHTSFHRPYCYVFGFAKCKPTLRECRKRARNSDSPASLFPEIKLGDFLFSFFFISFYEGPESRYVYGFSDSGFQAKPKNLVVMAV